MKKRLDLLVAELGLAENRTVAAKYILAGKIMVNDQIITKAGTLIDVSSNIKFCGELKKYVSRGGEKLELAIKTFNIDFTDKTVLDIGISTGGFTDCALQFKAKSVTGVDVGYGQVAMKLQNDRRVEIIERKNARYLDLNNLFDVILCDVSFISVLKLVHTFNKHLKVGGELIVLIKPQFEAGKEHICKGGIVKDKEVHNQIIDKIKKVFEDNNFKFIGIVESKILLPKGNLEFVSYWHKIN